MGVVILRLTLVCKLPYIQHIVLCLDYPPHNYTLMVEDPEGNMTDPIVQTSLATGSVIRIVVNDLIKDTRYLYYVVATNQFGSSKKSASVEISM